MSKEKGAKVIKMNKEFVGKTEEAEGVNEVSVKMFVLEVIANDLSVLLTQDIKFFTRLDIKGMLRQIEPVLKDFTELRMDFFKAHGTESKEGMYSLKKDISKELIEELNALVNKEFKFNFLLKKEDFAKVSGDYRYDALIELIEK